MKRIPRIADDMDGVVTYEFADGKRACFDARMVREYGIAELARYAGLGDQIPTKRLPVIHHGRVIGTMAADFDPDNIKSRSFLYDPRPGDFVREGDTWVAARNLGASDPDCVVGFARS